MIISINSTVHTVKIQAGTLLLCNTVFFLLSTYEVSEVNDLCMSASSPPHLVISGRPHTSMHVHLNENITIPTT